MFDGAGKYVTNGTAWTPDLSAEAQRRWLAGESASEIMRALSTPDHKLTRNAVISHLYRVIPAGTKRGVAANPQIGRFAWTPDLRALAVKMAAEGTGFRLIADTINATISEGPRVTFHSVRAMVQRQNEADTPGARVRGAMWSAQALKAIGEAWYAGESGNEVSAKYSGVFDGGRELPASSVKCIAERAGYARTNDSSRTTRAVTNQMRATRHTSAPAIHIRKPGMAGGALAPVARGSGPKAYAADVTGTLDLTLFQRGARCCAFVTGDGPEGPLYCGLPVDAATRKRTYCAGHHAQMHKPLPPRKINAPSSGAPSIRPRGGGFLQRWG